LALCIAVWTCGMVIMAFAASFAVLCVGRAVVGLGPGGVHPSCIGRDRRGRARSGSYVGDEGGPEACWSLRTAPAWRRAQWGVGTRADHVALPLAAPAQEARRATCIACSGCARLDGPLSPSDGAVSEAPGAEVVGT